MDENLGTLSYDMRARTAKFFQDMDALDQRVAASHARWNQMGIGGAGGGGFSSSGGSGHSPAVEAAMASTAGAAVTRGGAGPNFAGTSNGDVTWNLRQASAGTQARYGSGGRGRGGAGMEDDAPDQRIGDLTSDFISASRIRMQLSDARFQSDRSAERQRQQDLHDTHYGYDGGSRVRMAMSDAREQSRRSGVLEDQQDKYNELESQYKNSWRGKLNSGTSIQRLIRGTVIGLVADAAAGMAAASATYDQSMTLSGVDNIAKSRATNALQKHLLGSLPIVGGILGNAYDAAGGTAIETQNLLTERQLSFQDNRFSALMGRRQSIQQREGIAAGPNSLTSRLAALGAARTGISSSFQSESAAARAAFNAANPEASAPGFMSAVGAILRNRGGIIETVNDMAGQFNEYHDDVLGRRNRVDTFNKQQNSILAGRLGVNDQELAEAERTARYTLADSQASVARAIRQNQFSPGAADAEYSTATARNLKGYYDRPGTNQVDRDQYASSVEMLRQGDIGRQRDIQNNFRFGTGYQYTPQVESPLVMTDRAPETQTQVYDAFTRAIVELTNQLAAMNRGGNN